MRQPYKFECEQCKQRVDGSKSLQPKTFGPYLFLTLGRFDKAGEWFDRACTYPLILDMLDYLRLFSKRKAREFRRQLRKAKRGKGADEESESSSEESSSDSLKEHELKDLYQQGGDGLRYELVGLVTNDSQGKNLKEGGMYKVFTYRQMLDAEEETEPDGDAGQKAKSKAEVKAAVKEDEDGEDKGGSESSDTDLYAQKGVRRWFEFGEKTMRMVTTDEVLSHKEDCQVFVYKRVHKKLYDIE